MFWLIYLLVRFHFRWHWASSPCCSAALNFLLWVLHVLTDVFYLLGSISVDTALQAHAAAWHWAFSCDVTCFDWYIYLLGSISADTALQTHASARHWTFCCECFMFWLIYFPLLGSISADTALQTHAAARHWTSVPGRQLGVFSLLVLPQRLRSQVCDYGIFF